MYRLLASDIDDTLLAHDGSLPEQTQRALQLLHRKGVTVVLSSGRTTVSMRPIAAKIMEPADDEYLVSFNGGRVATALSDTVMFEALLPPQVTWEVMDYCRKHRLHVQGYDAEDFIVESGVTEWQEHTLAYAQASGLTYKRVADLPAVLDGGSIKMLIIEDPIELKSHCNTLNRMSGGRYSVMFSKPEYLEIVGAGINKGQALAMLATRLGIPLGACIAVGDSTNDIEMIQTAGMGVAVANARKELKDAADTVLSRSAGEAALVELVERFFPNGQTSSDCRRLESFRPPNRVCHL